MVCTLGSFAATFAWGAGAGIAVSVVVSLLIFRYHYNRKVA